MFKLSISGELTRIFLCDVQIEADNTLAEVKLYLNYIPKYLKNIQLHFIFILL